MTVRVEKPAINLRTVLAKLAGLKPAPAYDWFWDSGDSSETDFPLEQGWKPLAVFVDGALYRPGSGEDYTVSFDGFIYTVTFAVAPGSVDIAIHAVREC